MIRVVIATVLLTALITVPLTWAWVRRPRPVMPHRQRALLGESLNLLHQMLHPTDLDRLDVLSERTKQQAERLLRKYEKEIK